MRSKRVLKNIIYTSILQMVTIISGFIIPKIIISTYGSDVNGLISSITQFLAYITLLEAGIGPVIKAELYLPIAKKNNADVRNILKASDNYFKKIALFFLFYILILCIFFPFFFLEKYDYFFSMSLLIIISFSTFLEYYFGVTYRLFLQANQETYVLSIIQIIVIIFNTIVMFFLIKFGYGIQFVKVVSAFILILRPLIQNIYIRKKYKDILVKKEDVPKRIKNKKDGFAQHVATVIHGNIDVTILTFLDSLASVSIYSVYSLVVKGVKKIVESFTGGIDSLFGDMIAKNESDKLKSSFEFIEFFYITIISIIYTSTIILIIPFIKIYTFDFNDANYIVPVFSYLLVFGEFISAIRIPYNSLTKSAGKFKETKNGAWIEAIVNLIISFILVFKYGLVGIAIGTLVSVIIRTFEFIVFANKDILKRNSYNSFKLIIISIIELFFISILFIKFVDYHFIINYKNWFIYAVLIFICSSFIIIIVNIICNFKVTIKLFKYFKKKKMLK